MGQQLSATGSEGQHHAERCSSGYNGSMVETSIPVAAWRQAQLQNNRELQRENGRSSISGENGGNGASVTKSGISNNSRKPSGIRDSKDMSLRYNNPPSRNYKTYGLIKGSVGNGGGTSENSCGSADENGSGRNSSNSADGDVGRMSVRAAIDSFIENCLSARTEPPSGIQVNLSSITGLSHNSGNDKNNGSDAKISCGNSNSNKMNVSDKDSVMDYNCNSGEVHKKNTDIKSKKDHKSDLRDEEKKKDSLVSKNEGDIEKDCGKSDSNSDISEKKGDGSENQSVSENISPAGNEDDNERVNDNDNVLVIDCGNEDNDDRNNNAKANKFNDSKNNFSSSQGTSDSVKDSSKNKNIQTSKRTSASPHVIDVDSEEFPSPPGVLFTNGKKFSSDDKSSSPINVNNKDSLSLTSSPAIGNGNGKSNENYKKQMEKKTFSDFFHDRLMAQVESNEVSKKGSNILTWEVSNSNSSSANHPPIQSVAGRASSSPTVGGPVRLQTLIEKVLDQSLNSDSAPLVRNPKPTGSLSSAAIALPNTGASPSASSTSPPTSVMGSDNKSQGPTRIKVNTVCFKDHIEKVLEESFRSYEEEEEENEELCVKDDDSKKTLAEGQQSSDVEIIKESSSSGFDNQRNNNVSKVGPDGTIRVKDIVDRVISQAEVISKLLTPGQEQNRSGNSSSTQHNSNRNINGPSGPGGNVNLPNSQIQKGQNEPDHHSSGSGGFSTSSRPGPTGRKRGRPRLGSPNRSSSKNSDKGNNSNENRNHLQQQRAGYSPQGIPAHNALPSSDVRVRSGQGPPPLDYVPPQRLPGMPALVGAQGGMPSYHPNHHHQQHHPTSSHNHQSQQHSSSSYSSSVPSHPPSCSNGSHSGPNMSSASYPHHRYYNSGPPLPPSSHHAPGNHGPSPHHLPHHPPLHPQHRPGTSPPPSSAIHKRHPAEHTSTDGKPLPLLVMADHINPGAPSNPHTISASSTHHHPHHHHHHPSPSPRYIAMPHTPTPSCSCEICVETFSNRNRSPSHHPHNPHLHQHNRSSSSSNSNVPSPSSSSSYPPPPSHQSSSKSYVQRRDDHPSHHHPHHYHPYQQQYSSTSSRRSSITNDTTDLPKEALKPVIPANNSGGNQLPPQAIIPSYIAQRPHLDGSAASINSYPNPIPDHPDDERIQRRSSSFSDARPPHHPNSHYLPPQSQPHHPHYRNSSNIHEGGHSAFRPGAERPANSLPVDLHKPNTDNCRSAQFTPPTSASTTTPPSGAHDLPLDLSVKPISNQDKKGRPDDLAYGERRMSHHSDGDPRDGHSGPMSYPMQGLEDSVERNLPHPHQSSYQHQHNAYPHHSASTSLASARLPSPALLPQYGNEGPPPPQHHRSTFNNPEGKFYPAGHHHSSSSSSSSSVYPHPKHIESPTRPPHVINNSHHQYPSPHGGYSTTTLPTSGSVNSSLLSVPPHLQRNSSSSENSAQDNSKSYYHQRGSPYSDSNSNNPINKPDSDLPMPRLYQPARNPEDCPPASSRPVSSDNLSGEYSSPNTPRQPPPLMKPVVQHQPPPAQSQQPGVTNGSNTDDPDSLKHISRHEPIQNIIGNHPQNDILYLICKLCRQTYGSPYGFRKHFRNQHGFEPKVEHTIVQTISATKTAMGHSNVPEGGGFDESKYGHSHENNGNPTPYALDQAIKLEIPDNCSMEEFNSSQLAAYNRAQEHVKIIFKQGSGDDGSGNLENTKVLECSECGQTFQLNDFGSYKRHCRQHSMVQTSGPFSCHDCHRSFAEPGQLEQHLNTHNTFTPSVCGICRTFFSSPHYLAEHLQAAHGHVLPSEVSKISGNKSEPADSPLALKQEKMSPDMPQVYQSRDLKSRIERALMLENEMENASKNHGEDKSQSNNNTSSSSPSSVALKRTSPSLVSLPPTKRHRMSTSNSCSPPSSSMLTVLTPKFLEVQKRPADPVVSSASPDSSFDDHSKLNSSTPTTTNISATPSNDNAKDSAASNNSTSSSPIPPRDTNTTPIPSGRRSEDSVKSSTKSPSLMDMKPYMTGKGGNESDRCASVDSSNSDSNQSAPLASSPGLADESQVFYKHKKYSRHLKRHLSKDNNSSGSTTTIIRALPSTPTDSKVPKLDSSDNDNSSSTNSNSSAGDKDRKSNTPVSSSSSSTVTSSVNSRKEDCQSSSTSSSSSSSSKNKNSKSGSKNSSRSCKEAKEYSKSSEKAHGKDKSDKAKNKDSDSKKKTETKA